MLLIFANKMKYKIDYIGLETFLRRKDAEAFKGGHDAEIKPAKTVDDIKRFKLDRSKIKLSSIISVGMPYLIDSLGNDLTIVQSTNRNFKNPKGRLMRSKHVKTIILDCRKIYGISLNGMWVIPDRFIRYP